MLVEDTNKRTAPLAAKPIVLAANLYIPVVVSVENAKVGADTDPDGPNHGNVPVNSVVDMARR